MKQFEITPAAQLRGEIRLPASKSLCNRALVIQALSGSHDCPQNISDCDDTRVMMQALTECPDVVDIMASGTAMRFLTAYLCVTEGSHVITGTERMRHRPIRILVDALRQLGACVEYEGEEGFPPLRITGRRLQGGDICLPGNVSSQYISALLMVGPTLADGLRLTLTGEVVSRPYIDMTLSIMRRFGAQMEWESDNVLHVWPQPYVPAPYTVENDWSAAGYWYEMVALSTDENAEIRLMGLFPDSTQGDSRVADIFCPLGVQTDYMADGVVLRKKSVSIAELNCDMVNQPDLAQTVVATCIALGMHFHLTGLQSLKIKETDRMAALRTEFRKLGYEIGEANDSELMWRGERATQPCGTVAIDTYDDHRMAMALAPCCLRLGKLCINNPQVVSKSYPAYWQHLEHVGFLLTDMDN